MSLEIDRTLVLSTAHVSKATADILNGDAPERDGLKPAIDGHVADWGCYGWVVWCGGQTVPKIELDAEMLYMPADLHRVVMFARDNNCQYVRFDCDADEIDELPTWEW